MHVVKLNKKHETHQLSPSFSPFPQVEQIQAEYKVLALQHHPDKNAGDKEAEAKFQKLKVRRKASSSKLWKESLSLNCMTLI